MRYASKLLREKAVPGRFQEDGNHCRDSDPARQFALALHGLNKQQHHVKMVLVPRKSTNTRQHYTFARETTTYPVPGQIEGVAPK